MSAWSGIIQLPESDEAGERPVVDGDGMVVAQEPVKARFEQA